MCLSASFPASGAATTLLVQLTVLDFDTLLHRFMTGTGLQASCDCCCPLGLPLILR